VPKKKKPSNLTDKQLLRRLFPKEVRKALKQTVLELDSEKERPKKRQKT
jgi:hypothetical protein